jgi:precorrin-6B methylase 2
MRWFEIIEEEHELQNPTSADKVRLLGQRLGLGPSSVLLDVGSGRGGPAVLLAAEFGCKVTAVEHSEIFASAAKNRAARAGVEGLVSVVHCDAALFTVEPRSYDGAVCLGASFIWGGMRATVEVLSEAVRPGGAVAVGEPYWRRWPLPHGYEPPEGYGFAPLSETVERFESSGTELITLIASSQDDWDRYVSLQWSTLERWLRQNPADPDAQEFRAAGREERDLYLRWHRDLLGWAIFVGCKG